VIKKTPKKLTTNLTQDAFSHSRDLLLALSRAAQAIQQARTTEEVYRAIGNQIKSLGGEVSLFMVDDDRQAFTVVYTSYAPGLIRRVEKKMGNSVIGYRFALEPNSKHARNIAAGKTIYAQSIKKYVAEMLPKDIHLLADQFAGLLEIEQGIFAPLRVDDETLGLMFVSSLSLNKSDVPAMESFAGQIAASLSNVRLAQQMRNELSARRQAEETLRESEERYRTLFDSMMDGIYRSTHAGRLVDVNHAMVKMFGYSSREEMLAVDIKKDLYFSPGERGGHISNAKQVEIKIYPMKRRDGSEIWVEDHGYYVHDEQGNILYREGMLRDITARKQAEENSLLQSAALEAAANAIAIIDIKGMIQWVNPAWVTLTGYSKEESVGQNARIIKSEKHDRLFYKNMWDTILAGKVWRGELMNRRKDGGLYFEEETITPVLDKQGNVMNFIAIKSDVTERKQKEEELRLAREELEKANLELKFAFEHEQHLAHTDALTGVNNRRHLFELAEHEFDVARRYDQSLSAIMFDLDHFKQINDTLGHALGDQMLERVIQIACAQLRDVDLIGRYGGEEFVIILPVTGAQQAYLLAERIRIGVEALRIETESIPAFVTLSIGIAEMLHAPQDGSVENLISRADKAMYAAKQAGRNFTMIFGADEMGAI
jgi:diguanylate cyclase (GGDEF)-like protein/PAS domain S-box-containing protein